MVSIISGKFKGRKLHTASGPGYRPATARVRESLFSTLQSMGVDWSGLRVLDLFAGSGALALEALSRGAEYALLLEKDKRAAGVLKRNLKELDIPPEKGRVITRDVFSFLDRPSFGDFGLVFIDPPYGRNYLQPAVDSLLHGRWLTEDAFIQAEIESGLALPEFDGLQLAREKLYGQTKVCIWKKRYT
jgi:16S rRNA (guanine966-N2)-methyltransferase